MIYQGAVGLEGGSTVSTEVGLDIGVYGGLVDS